MNIVAMSSDGNLTVSVHIKPGLSIAQGYAALDEDQVSDQTALPLEARGWQYAIVLFLAVFPTGFSVTFLVVGIRSPGYS